MIYFGGDLSNNSCYYYFWSPFMMIMWEIRWERGWCRRYQLYLQYFSISFRNSREISITFWWIININFNFKSMIWSICILWNRQKKNLFHRIISFISNISIHNDYERNYYSNKLVRIQYLNLSVNEVVNTSSMTNDEKYNQSSLWKILIIGRYCSKIFCISWHSILRIFHFSKYWRTTELCRFFLFLSELSFEFYIWSILYSISWFEIVKNIYCPLVMFRLDNRKFEWLQKIYSLDSLSFLFFM